MLPFEVMDSFYPEVTGVTTKNYIHIISYLFIF